MLERARGINVSRLGPRHLETGTITANLAALLLSAGRLGQEAVSIFEELSGVDNPRASGKRRYGRRGKDVSACAGYRRASPWAQSICKTFEDPRALAALLRETEKTAQAAEIEKRSLEER